ncbi:MAG: hypothetical protein AAF368_10815 [Planctomycetota bacterium]
MGDGELERRLMESLARVHHTRYEVVGLLGERLPSQTRNSR